MISPQNRRIDIGTRFGSMLLDHIMMTMVAMLFFAPAMISAMMSAFELSHEPTEFNIMSGWLGYVGIFGFALYFCKDIVNGRSLAKRILKLQVVDNKTGLVATPFQCFIRNIFCMFWMVEGIVALANTSRRLGDRVAGTKLVYYDPAAEHPTPSAGKVVFPLAVCYGLMLLIVQALPLPATGKTDYSKTSFNQSESKALERLMTDSLGDYLSADIRIYDTVMNKNLKYLSVILTLKENYIEDEFSYKQLHNETTRLIYSHISPDTFTGQIRYVYKGKGQFQSTSTTLGTQLPFETK